jgi:hypothetical protein
VAIQQQNQINGTITDTSPLPECDTNKRERKQYREFQLSTDNKVHSYQVTDTDGPTASKPTIVPTVVILSTLSNKDINLKVQSQCGYYTVKEGIYRKY